MSASPSRSDQLNSFNAIRLFAALQVAYIHATAALKLTPLPGYEWIAQFPGVPIFFVISGYLVFDSLLRLPLLQFLTHRTARIYPALIVNITLIEVLLFFAGQTEFFSVKGAGEFFIAYVATASDGLAALWAHNAGPSHTFNGLFKFYPSGVLWTLTVELTFYLVIPLVLLAKSRFAQTCLVAFATVSSFIFQLRLGSGISSMDNWPISVFVFPYFWMFGIGMLFRLWPPPVWAVRPGALLLFAAFAATAWSRHLVWFEWKVDPSPSASVQTVLLCLLVLFVGYSPILKSRMLTKHDMSYGIYLYHMLIVTLLINVPMEIRTRWLLLIVLAGGMLAGLISWHLIERPFMRLARKTSQERNVGTLQASL